MKRQQEIIIWHKYSKEQPGKEYSTDNMLVHVIPEVVEDEFVTEAVWKEGLNGWSFYWFEDEELEMDEVYAWAMLPTGWVR